MKNISDPHSKASLNLPNSEVVIEEYRFAVKDKTSRFPTVVSLNVIAAVCLQTLYFNCVFTYAFIAVFIMTGSPPILVTPYLGRLPIWVPLYELKCVGPIVQVL